MKAENSLASPASVSRGQSAGFTLIELMITVVIAAVLLSIAIPLYQHQIRESRRTDARSALLELAAREERYFDTNNVYTSTASNLGYSGFGSASYPVGNGQYYYIKAVTVTAGSGTTPPTFTLEADPIPGKGQDQDTDCAKFLVDSKGDQTSQNSAGAANNSICWQ
ncbi:MAG: type IV pilin protein [Steroidobacteraceae bacterium]